MQIMKIKNGKALVVTEFDFMAGVLVNLLARKNCTSLSDIKKIKEK